LTDKPSGRVPDANLGKPPGGGRIDRSRGLSPGPRWRRWLRRRWGDKAAVVSTYADIAEEGASVSELVAEADPTVDADLWQSLDATMIALGAIKTVGALVMGAIEAVVAQTRSIERAVSALSLDAIAFEGSDSLDNPDAVFQ
jgi:uncharacterized iron-regulated protein